MFGCFGRRVTATRRIIVILLLLFGIRIATVISIVPVIAFSATIAVGLFFGGLLIVLFGFFLVIFGLCYALRTP